MNVQPVVPTMPLEVKSLDKLRMYDDIHYEKIRPISSCNNVKKVWEGRMGLHLKVAIIKVEINESNKFFKRDVLLNEVALRRFMQSSPGYNPILHVFELPVRKNKVGQKIVWIEPFFNGDLYSARDLILSENLLIPVIAKMKEAVLEAHKRNLVLSDIKPENILFDFDHETKQFKLALTDLAGAYFEGTKGLTDGWTIGYAPPEKVLRRYTFPPRSLDIYCLAVTITFLYNNKFSFPSDISPQSKDPKNDYLKACRSFWRYIPSDCPYLNDLKQMLLVEASLRPKITEVLK